MGWGQKIQSILFIKSYYLIFLKDDILQKLPINNVKQILDFVIFVCFDKYAIIVTPWYFRK